MADRNRHPRIAPLREFLSTETGGGLLLLVATVAALAWANSAWASTYSDTWHRHVDVFPSVLQLDLDLRHWVNDGLMTVFFFLIGLEIKRELVTGELRDPRTALLPAVAALGGMALPAGLYLLVADAEAARGWGVPMATDIAFAVGVLALVGSKVPAGLKLFLLTLAIVDDIGAIAVIAIFYAGDIHVGWLGVAVAVLACMPLARLVRLTSPAWYAPLGAAAWYATFRAGVHPTIAGVAVGLLTPARPVRGRSVLEDLEHRLHPFSSYAIVPLFALANAGVSLREGLVDALTSRVALGVIAGLVVGKTLGIALVSLGTVRAGMTKLPHGVDRVHVVGAGAVGGIGFTVALFIASMAFSDPAIEANAKVGILAGSLVSGLLGATILASRRVPES